MNKIVLFLAILLASAARAQTFSVTVLDSLPDPGIEAFPINVSGLPSSIDTIYGLQSVCVNITHSYCADLYLRLISPDGTVIPVLGGIGGGDDNFFTCIDGTAALPISSASAPYSGSWRSGKLHLANNSQNPNGVWILECEDTYGADMGFLQDFSLTFSTTPSKPPSSIQSSNLPIVKLTTTTGEIVNDPKTEVYMQIINHAPGIRNYTTDIDYQYEGRIMAELQGFSSPSNPKKNYDFNLIDAAGNTIDTTLLGMPADNDWVLKAEWTDYSLINNALTYAMARKMDNYAPRTIWCEVILDGEYLGLYNLTEQIKRSKKRVNIDKINPADIAGAALTGGYIIEMNINGDPGAWNSAYPPINSASCGLPVEFKHVYPKATTIQPQQADYIKSYVDSFENSINASTYTDPVEGWRRFASESSFIDFLLVNEFSMNYDSYGRSTFMYKNESKKINIGPSWDYDRGFSNDPNEGWVWQITHLGWPFPNWWQRMYDDTLFRHKLACRYKSLRADTWATDSFHVQLDAMKNNLSEAIQRNVATWAELGIADSTAWFDIIESRKDFLIDRLAWMDATLLTSTYSLPPIPPLNTTYCAGSAINLYTSPEYTYNFITGPDTSNFTPTQAGNYIAEVSDEFGCYSRKYFSVIDNANAQFSLTNTGGLNYTFAPIDITATTYNWDFGDGITATSPNPIHTFANNGTYQVQLTTTNASGCTDTYTLQLNTLTSLHETPNTWTLAPNPANTQLTIQTTSTEPLLIQLFDAKGRLLLQQSSLKPTMLIDTKAYPNGTYMLQLSTPVKVLGTSTLLINH